MPSLVCREAPCNEADNESLGDVTPFESGVQAVCLGLEYQTSFLSEYFC